MTSNGYRKGRRWTDREDEILRESAPSSREADEQLAKRFNRTLAAVRCRRHWLLRQPRWNLGGSKEADSDSPYLPTPEEIAASAEEIRQTWSEAEKVSRIMDDRDRIAFLPVQAEMLPATMFGR